MVLIILKVILVYLFVKPTNLQLLINVRNQVSSIAFSKANLTSPSRNFETVLFLYGSAVFLYLSTTVITNTSSLHIFHSRVHSFPLSFYVHGPGWRCYAGEHNGERVGGHNHSGVHAARRCVRVAARGLHQCKYLVL